MSRTIENIGLIIISLILIVSSFHILEVSAEDITEENTQATIKHYTDCYFDYPGCTGRVVMGVFDDGRSRALTLYYAEDGSAVTLKADLEAMVESGQRLDDIDLDTVKLKHIPVHGPGGRDWDEKFKYFVAAFPGLKCAVYRDDVWIDGVLPENWEDPNR